MVKLFGIFLVCAQAAFGQQADLNADGCVDLKDYAKLQAGMSGPDCRFEPGLVEMMLVPGGGSGPAYDFLIGKFEITTGQFAQFLNEAQLDGGASHIGSFMSFGPDYGDGVVTVSEAPAFVPRGVQFAMVSNALIMYHPQAPIGTRYVVVPGFESHPVDWVSWIGAAKFCNWLTLKEGMTPDDFCYNETQDPTYWGPRTGWATWPDRDLNQDERQQLVDECRGYRLPMDNLGNQYGPIGLQDNPFNEWFKAMSYDPNGLTTFRFGPTGEPLPLYHWTYSFGRDTLSPGDANDFYYGPTPVGFYNGVNIYNGVPTNRNNNPFGIFDGSGNVGEFLQDAVVDEYGAASHRSYRGGMPNTFRSVIHYMEPWASQGFRVIRVPQNDMSGP